jgi:predicted transcriptional regulator
MIERTRCFIPARAIASPTELQSSFLENTRPIMSSIHIWIAEATSGSTAVPESICQSHP